jgi:hypothetical protein
MKVDSITIGTTMGVYFNNVTGSNTRGSPILSYHLEIDSTNNGAGPFTEIGGLTTYSL